MGDYAHALRRELKRQTPLPQIHVLAVVTVGICLYSLIGRGWSWPPFWILLGALTWLGLLGYLLHLDVRRKGSEAQDPAPPNAA